MKKIKHVVKANQEKVIPFVWVNGGETEVTVDVELAGEGAKATLLGLFLGTGNHSLLFNTNVVHKAPRTFSRTELRGVFREHAVFSNDGMVRIDKGARGADGFFASKIALFDDAKGRSVPSLEIDENDLKAGHASTVGRPPEEQLFYLQSRGLTREQAEQLIISGFFSPIIDKLPDKQKKEAEEKLATYLQTLS